MAVLFALVTILAWGTWLLPSHRLAGTSQQVRIFYVAVANLFLSALILVIRGEPLGDLRSMAYPFAGGLAWSLGALCAFTAISRIGVSRAFGIWAPLNILTGIVWGEVLWREFSALPGMARAATAGGVLMVLAGVLLIIRSGTSGDTEIRRAGDLRTGILLALGAGILWGSYFIPNDLLRRQMPEATLWQLAFPLACGIFVGCTALLLVREKRLVMPRPRVSLRVLLSGLLWSTGNFSMLLLVGELGPGKGFTLSQLCIVVNALAGILLFREPPWKTRSAAYVLAGTLMAMAGAILVGNAGAL